MGQCQRFYRYATLGVGRQCHLNICYWANYENDGKFRQRKDGVNHPVEEAGEYLTSGLASITENLNI